MAYGLPMKVTHSLDSVRADVVQRGGNSCSNKNVLRNAVSRSKGIIVESEHGTVQLSKPPNGKQGHFWTSFHSRFHNFITPC